jgi:hypothetical protein
MSTALKIIIASASVITLVITALVCVDINKNKYKEIESL